MLLPYATWRASEGHFVRALQACVHYFSAYPRTYHAREYMAFFISFVILSRVRLSPLQTAFAVEAHVTERQFSEKFCVEIYLIFQERTRRPTISEEDRI
jgi:hypothetical protein